MVKLEDLRGKPIEFRQYGSKNPPAIGTKWICPTCQTVYFAWWNDAKWQSSHMEYSKFVIDLSYYATFNDEPDYEGTFDYEHDTPAALCTDNADDWQDVWGDFDDDLEQDSD